MEEEATPKKKKIKKGDDFKYDDSVREKIRRMRSARMKWTEIAGYYEISCNRLKTFARTDPYLYPHEKPGASITKKVLTPEHKEKLLEYLEHGMGLNEIAEKIGITYKTLYNRMRESDDLIKYIKRQGRGVGGLSETQLKKIYDAAACGTRIEHIAAMIGMSRTWLYEQIRTDGTQAYHAYNEGKAMAIAAVEEVAYQKAMEGHFKFVDRYLTHKDDQIAPTPQIIEERRKEESKSSGVSVATYLKYARMSETEILEELKRENIAAAKKEASRKNGGKNNDGS